VPLFLELPRGGELDAPKGRVLVASPTPPAERAGWEIVTSAAIESSLPAIVEWALERLPADTGLELEDALRWLREGPLVRGELQTLGAALGWCGALDELGLDRVRSKSPLEVAQRYLNRRLKETLGEEHQDYDWLRKHSLELLIGMARRALTDDALPYAVARDLDNWLELVPEPFRAGFDVDWMRLSLSRVDSSIRPADIERAARLLSPGSFRVIRGLRAAALLTGTDDALTPSPHWLAELAAGEAERRVLDGSPFEWGEALLRPHAAPRIARHLFQRALAADATAVAKLVEAEVEDNPAHTAAVETSFTVTGIAALSGAELDPELVEALWEEQSELWLDAGGLPRPRIEHPRSLDRTALLERGAWYAAALASSELLDADTPGRHPLLRPWRESGSVSDLSDIYDAIHGAALVADEVGENWGERVGELIDRLKKSVGTVNADIPHLLELPSLVLDEIERGEASWETCARLPRTELGRFLGVVRGRGVELFRVSEALFLSWHRAGTPKLAGSLLDPAGNVLYSGLPAELLPEVLTALDAQGLLLDGSLLGPAALSALGRCLSERALGSELRASLVNGRAPDALAKLLGDCLDADAGSDVVRPFWVAAPAECLAELERRIAHRDLSAALRLSQRAPDREAAQVIAYWRASEVPRYELGELVEFLHGRIRSRVAGWRDAYALLGEIERGRPSV
jgi:hypothetical protein